MPSWTANVTARGTIAGPAGLALADLPDRIIAYFVDGLILGIIGYILSAITTNILGDSYTVFFTYKGPSLLSTALTVVLLLAISAGYFIYMWTKSNGSTVGMRLRKISLRDAASGGPVSQNQAIYRWALLYAPWALIWFYQWSVLGWVIWLAAIGWEIYLLYTTANSPTRQGFHDAYAKTIVAKVT